MSEKVGVFDRLGWGSTSPATVELEFQPGSTLGLNEAFLDTQGIAGTRARHKERTRAVSRRVEGNLVFTPTPLELDTLLPLILGGTKSVNSIPLAETIPSSYFGVVRDGTLYNYTGVYVDQATFSADEGGPMRVSMNVIGTDETISGSFPALSIDITQGPYVLSDATVTIGGTTYTFTSFELTISNFLDVRQRNSLTPTAIRATNRAIEISLPIPLGDTYNTLYGSSLSGLNVVLTLTNGAKSLTFTMPGVQAPRQPVPFGERGILHLPWRGVARKSGSSDELSVANVS